MISLDDFNPRTWPNFNQMLHTIKRGIEHFIFTYTSAYICYSIEIVFTCFVCFCIFVVGAPNQICGNRNVRTTPLADSYATQRGYLTVRFRSGPTNSIHRGFDMIVTAFHLGNYISIYRSKI